MTVAPSLYVTVRELADALHRSPQHIRDLIEDGEISGVVCDRKPWLIPRREYDRLTGTVAGHEAVSSSATEQMRSEELRALRLMALELAQRIAKLED